ncbi:hypothetical protein FVA81_04760 [Rhizobium sp. WL3]|uniref:hypothetical protein n=1 Tax=Rhizobium sp. WL3 TaxID=2603277 RepID=UPI0011C1F213|nr:hypothetical protein [Rhizobium sp. WL3]QEE43965.1 hypothetical protein FVA81_04760 [Rhizobium sp. WL3]
MLTDDEIEFGKSSGSPDSKREQSTIAFPYLDLDAAIEVAKAIYSRSGLGSCELDELAAEMNQTMSGAFRLKTGTARIFDLTEKEGKSGIRLSELGREIVSPDSERAARVEAFMRVPLYKAVYDKYRGHLLPPMKALEREMTGLGVAVKQADKARQAFERSARQAGYFESGDDRLIRPKISEPTKRGEDQVSNGASSEDAQHRELADKGATLKSGNDYHPFVQGLLDELPRSDQFTQWELHDQAEWLQAAASIFKLLSKKKGRVEVKVWEEKETPIG